tara:strand:- start:692 stop:1135 length:444 start_codon:yes stop_codon:yes gene_type:complete
MPNWTQNHVAFEGSKEKIIELKELFASDERVFDFNKILPMPKDSEGFQATGNLTMDAEKEDVNNWYFWSIKNWGTKWNAVDGHLDVDNEDRLEYSFRTAWDAPRGVIEKLWYSGALEGCTDISWECAHEFEEDVETIIGKKPKEQHE